MLVVRGQNAAYKPSVLVTEIVGAQVDLLKGKSFTKTRNQRLHYLLAVNTKAEPDFAQCLAFHNSIVELFSAGFIHSEAA